MDNKTIDRIIDDLFDILPVLHKKLVGVLNEGSAEGVSHYHFVILHMLSGSEAPAVSEIGKKIAVSRPQMTAIINKLVSLGLATRSPDSRDRRIIRIAITPHGKKVLSRMRAKIKTRLQKRLSHLNAGDLETFYTSLLNIRDIGFKME